MMIIRAALGAVLAVGLLAVPLVGEGQPAGKVYRVGYLGYPTRSAESKYLEVFQQRLRELGYVEGQNVVIEYRWAEGRPDRLAELAADLVRLRVDVLAAAGNPSIVALKGATKTIPIVMVVAGDPVGAGLIRSLDRPGGNVTGLSNLAEGLSAKWLELLKEAAPALARLAVLLVPDTPAHAAFSKEIQVAAQRLGVTIQFLEVRDLGEIQRAFDALTKVRCDALIVLPHPVTFAHRQQIVGFAAKNKLPGMYPWAEFPEAGGLMAYAASRAEMFRRSATYVDKILKGAKPADLPVEQPTKFDLVINLKTANALGLTIPPSLLGRADEVLQ
jgi:putative tryptophan/tyrosine transport system substrate-binding protein